MVIRQSNENNRPGSQLRGSQFSWCADGLSEKHWALPGVLLLHWLLICVREFSLCVNALYDGRGKCQREKYCAWIWSGKGKTSTMVSWTAFAAFVTERHPVNSDCFTSCCQYQNLHLSETSHTWSHISHYVCSVSVTFLTSTALSFFFFPSICYIKATLSQKWLECPLIV